MYGGRLVLCIACECVHFGEEFGVAGDCFLVPDKLVGVMLSSLSQSRCLCSSYSGHSVNICSQVWMFHHMGTCGLRDVEVPVVFFDVCMSELGLH
jgi:hypothetical protein